MYEYPEQWLEGRGVACDFCRVSLVTSVPVSLVTSQSLPLQIAAVSLLADLWLPWRPLLALLSLLLPLPPPPLHPLSWCTRCSRGSAHDAHEVDRFDAKHVVALVATYYIPFPPPFEAEHEGRRLTPLVRIFAFLTISLCLCICMCLYAYMPRSTCRWEKSPLLPEASKSTRKTAATAKTKAPLPPSEQQQPRCSRPGCGGVRPKADELSGHGSRHPPCIPLNP